MKNILLTLCFLLLLSSCDDGDIEVASFDFTDATVQVCQAGGGENFFLYVMKDARALIIKIPDSNFDNQLVNPTKSITIDAANLVIYREYAGNVSSDNICAFPTNASLGLQKEWNGVGGTIRIETSVAKVDDAVTGQSSFPTYNHRISLINPSFSTGTGGEQKMDIVEFGTYSKINLNNLQPFDPTRMRKCNTSNIFYNFNGRQSIELTVDNSIFDTSVLDTPKTRTFNGTTNKLLFKVLNANVTADYFCGTTVPGTPTAAEEWTTAVGASANGLIEVTTSTIPGNPSQFTHRIVLRNAVVVRNNLNFNFGANYFFGQF